ncbi:MAG: nicotinate-nucleotide adenylyltransferase [Eubacterium sp.]|jgi:nicotinate-nucleotide adenylyltransferase|nr:nicotinate-nucleotide adenylyltransferase [Eubacterium sp.]
MKKKKIGLMGGTFNPVHYGHLLIAENAYEQFELDEVIFMPTGSSPHKDSRQILDAEHRMEMLRLATADNPHFTCSDYEISRQGVSYTHLTIRAFHDQKKDCGLYFIMGADSLAYFDTWRCPDEISRLSVILAAVRDGLNMEELLPIREQLWHRYGTKVGFINTPNFSVSSNIIRQRVMSHHSIRYLVPDSVGEYIRENQIYQNRPGN